MDIKIVNEIFIKSTQRVLDLMTSCKATAGKSYIKKDKIALGDYSAIVCASCPKSKKKGSISFSLNTSAAECLGKAMFGDDFVANEESMSEMTGEFVNVISGDARRRMADEGVVYDGTTPKMLSGDGHEITHDTKSPIVVVPFEVAGGKCFVEFGFEF